MNDIRQTLRDRLASIKKEREELMSRIQRLTELEKSVEATLAYEDVLHGSVACSQQELALHKSHADGLADFLAKALHNGPRTLEQLKTLPGLSSFIKEDTQPGRAINFALVGLQRVGQVERLENGAWKLISGSSQNGVGHLR